MQFWKHFCLPLICQVPKLRFKKLLFKENKQFLTFNLMQTIIATCVFEMAIKERLR